MALWLFKEEPSHYAYADLERDGTTEWDGVSNALAKKHLRQCRAGDRVFYYHTGKEKAIVGVMEVIRPAEPQSDDASVVVKPVRQLASAVPLSVIKADPVFAGWDLVRNSRLSVLPVTREQWLRIEALSNGAP